MRKLAAVGIGLGIVGGLYVLLPPLGRLPELPRPKVIGTAGYIGHGSETMTGYSVTGPFSIRLTEAQKVELDRELRATGFVSTRMRDRMRYRREVMTGLARGSQSITVLDDGAVFGGRSIRKLFSPSP